MGECRKTKLFSILIALIIDDLGHRKSGNLTVGVGRQYIGEIGKTYNGIVVVTTHFYDGVKRLPLDIEIRKKLILYQKEKNHNLSGNPTSAMSLKVY